jgi:hypothetical protein
MLRNIEMNNPAMRVTQNNKNKQHPKANRWHHEKIH